ncbi:MAG: hypothetical protein IPI53_09370 [Saprospiraceae bacterium]|nr:hypothetical protein [Saprospiraceae bacterium]
MFFKYKIPVLILFMLFTALCGYYVTQLKFSFSFDQFFPKGDPDYKYYQSFIKDFETDDNFLLVGLPNAPTVFDSVFLKK